MFALLFNFLFLGIFLVRTLSAFFRPSEGSSGVSGALSTWCYAAGNCRMLCAALGQQLPDRGTVHPVRLRRYNPQREAVRCLHSLWPGAIFLRWHVSNPFEIFRVRLSSKDVDVLSDLPMATYPGAARSINDFQKFMDERAKNQFLLSARISKNLCRKGRLPQVI